MLVSHSTAIHLIDNGRAELVWNGKEEAVTQLH